jgi:hypothetical protein
MRTRPFGTGYLLRPGLRVRRLPDAVPLLLAVFLGVCAVTGYPMAMPGPRNPFIAVNGLGVIVESVLCVLLASRHLGRRFAALLLAVLTPLAGLFLALPDWGPRYDVRGCVWFVPMPMPLVPHLAVLGVLCAVATLVFLREETRAQDRAYGPDADDPRALRRLVRPFE